MKRGKQKHIPTPGKNKWHHVFGAYNWITGELVYTTAEKTNSKTFCLFLQQLVANTSDERPIFYVLDNASYHHSNVSEAMIAFFEDKAVPVWLPPYCSELNPIERYWRHLKDKVCANRLFETIDDVVDSVVKVLDLQNDLTSNERFLFQNTCYRLLK